MLNLSGMSQEDEPSAEKESAASPHAPLAGEKKSGASLSRLTAAFANMMTSTGKSTANKAAAGKRQKDSASPEPSPAELSVTPRGIIEAILFVGLPSSSPNAPNDSESRSDNRLEPNGEALPAETIAGAMRDVSVEEVAIEIEALNEQYEEDESPYRIEASTAGYRMVLREAFHPMRDRFHGRTRSAKLTPAALEVLSIVAYQQPISAEEITDLRDERSTTAITQLVRRGLLEPVEEPTKEIDDSETDQANAKSNPVKFRTTERFLKVLELEAINQLPQVAEHDD